MSRSTSTTSPTVPPPSLYELHPSIGISLFRLGENINQHIIYITNTLLYNKNQIIFNQQVNISIYILL